MLQKQIDYETALSSLTNLLTAVKEGVRAGGCSVLSPPWYHVPVPIYVYVKWVNLYCHYFRETWLTFGQLTWSIAR